MPLLVATRTTHLPEPYLHRASIPPYLLVATRIARIQSSIPYLHTLTSTRLDRDSNSPYLHTPITPRCYVSDTVLELHTSIPPSTRIQYASGALELHTSMLARLHASRTPPEFHTYKPPRRCTYNAPQELQASIPPRRYTYIGPAELHISYFHVCTPAALLPSSRTQWLHDFTSPHLQRASRTSLPPHLHVANLPNASRP